MHKSPSSQKGASFVLWLIALVPLFGAAALAIDMNNLYVSIAELHNAGDAGALEGALNLYSDDGTTIQESANDAARDAAEANYSRGSAVEASVQRGHWRFDTAGGGTFTANPSLDPVDLVGKTFQELNDDLDEINAVEVVTERRLTPVQAFFGQLLGIQDYDTIARAVAYVGYAGTLLPQEVDQPIAICQEAVLSPEGSYDCSVGRFIPSSDALMSETGGWTNFNQEDACTSGSPDAAELKELVCGSGNPVELVLGKDMGTQGGQVESAFKDLYDCWTATTNKIVPWGMTLPVVVCGEKNLGPCNKLVGAVDLNVLYIVDNANKIDDDAPWQMAMPDMDGDGVSDGQWSNDDPDGIVRWDSFVGAFNIQRPDGELAVWSDDPQLNGWRQKTIYFAPDCSFHAPTGLTGGLNFGVRADVPVLVD